MIPAGQVGAPDRTGEQRVAAEQIVAEAITDASGRMTGSVDQFKIRIRDFPGAFRQILRRRQIWQQLIVRTVIKFLVIGMDQNIFDAKFFVDSGYAPDMVDMDMSQQYNRFIVIEFSRRGDYLIRIVTGSMI